MPTAIPKVPLLHIAQDFETTFPVLLVAMLDGDGWKMDSVVGWGYFRNGQISMWMGPSLNRLLEFQLRQRMVTEEICMTMARALLGQFFGC
jgi:hypothetical protein